MDYKSLVIQGMKLTQILLIALKSCGDLFWLMINPVTSASTAHSIEVTINYLRVTMSLNISL